MNPNSERFLGWYPDYIMNKELVYDHYGRKCRCCGVTYDLTIDHINGDGKRHRQEIGSKNLYRWLVQNGFPDGFQTLCRICNSSKCQGDHCHIHHQCSPPCDGDCRNNQTYTFIRDQVIFYQYARANGVPRTEAMDAWLKLHPDPHSYK